MIVTVKFVLIINWLD